VSVTRAAWVLTLMGYEGTPFQHQGRLPGVGMDCPAPMILAAREHGLVAPSFDVQAYPSEPDGSLQPLLDAHLTRVPREALQLGDVVLNAFRLKKPRHLAYIVGERYGEWELLHADAVTGRVQVERLQYGRYYRFVQGYAVPGVQ
jgi:hypothetical protein